MLLFATSSNYNMATIWFNSSFCWTTFSPITNELIYHRFPFRVRYNPSQGSNKSELSRFRHNITGNQFGFLGQPNNRPGRQNRTQTSVPLRFAKANILSQNQSTTVFTIRTNIHHMLFKHCSEILNRVCSNSGPFSQKAIRIECCGCFYFQRTITSCNGYCDRQFRKLLKSTQNTKKALCSTKAKIIVKLAAFLQSYMKHIMVSV